MFLHERPHFSLRKSTSSRSNTICLRGLSSNRISAQTLLGQAGQYHYDPFHIRNHGRFPKIKKLWAFCPYFSLMLVVSHLFAFTQGTPMSPCGLRVESNQLIILTILLSMPSYWLFMKIYSTMLQQ